MAFVLPLCCANALRASNSNLKLFHLPEHNRMSHSLSSPSQNAEALLSASSSIAADRSSAVTGDESSREIRQVLSELLSGNTVIPSKNRVKYGVITLEDQSQDGVKSARLKRYVEITKDNMGRGAGAVIRYFVCAADAHVLPGLRPVHALSDSETGDLATSELDLVGSAVLHGCIFGPTKNPRGGFKHCIRIDLAKEFQPALSATDEVQGREAGHARAAPACRHHTPLKLVLCLTSETEKKEWLQALTDALAMTESGEAATTIVLSALSRNAGKQFELAVAKLVSSDPGDDRIRDLLADILTQLMGPTAIIQNPQLVRDGLNCIGTLVERMPNKMRSRVALNMFVPATITQTDSASPPVALAALQVLATVVRCCKEHILPFFYGIFQAILRHIDSNDKEMRAKANGLSDTLMKLTEIKNAKEVWQKTLDKHLELILTASCDSEREQRTVAALNLQREKRIQDVPDLFSSRDRDASGTLEILTAAAASKIMLELRFQWLELLIDKDKLDFFELGGSPLVPHAVQTLLDAACIDDLRIRAQLAAQILNSIRSSPHLNVGNTSISSTDTELAQVLVPKTTPEYPMFVRNLAFMFVAKLFQLHPAAVFPFYASFVRNVLTALPHQEIPCARSVNEQMQKSVRGPPLLGAEGCTDLTSLLALIEAITSHLDACSHLECSDTLSWITVFNYIYPTVFLDCMDKFLPPFMRLLVNCDGLNRLSGPEAAGAQLEQGDLRGCVPIAIDLFASIARQQGSCVKLVEVLIDCLAQLKSEALLSTTRDVVGSLFACKQSQSNSLSPLDMFTQICVQLQLKKSQRRFCHLMSHSLVSLLFVKAELECLRVLLSQTAFSATSAEFFETCFKGFSSNPVALVALCFYARMYPLAAAVIQSFAEWELSLSFETEVQYVVRLLQGPTMQSVRFDLHGGSGHQRRHQAWWALNALLAIIPEMCEHFAPLQLLLESCPLPPPGFAQCVDLGDSALNASASDHRELTEQLSRFLRDCHTAQPELSTAQAASNSVMSGV